MVRRTAEETAEDGKRAQEWENSAREHRILVFSTPRNLEELDPRIVLLAQKTRVVGQKIETT